MEAPEPKKATLDIEHAPISPDRPSPLRKMFLVASIAAGVQFGWALQLSLLTPYVQLLGVPHFWSSFIWLCGPISGMLVQPTVGYYSDRCTSKFGRRRLFIVSGAALVALAAFLIGFAADIGDSAGDNPKKTPKPRAIATFVVGFWVLDVANNMLQGPCRAFLADLSASDSSKTSTSFSFFAFFMAVGNILGYAAGSYRHLYKLLPFTQTAACDVFCANLKSCFFISIALLLTLTILAACLVTEKQFIRPPKDVDVDTDTVVFCRSMPFFGEILGALKDLKKPMWILMAVTALNWIAWFPFFLFDTDWMGKEVFGGEVGDKLYGMGVSAGSMGLVLQSVVLGAMSLAIQPLSRLLGGVKRLWALVNLVLAVCLGLMVVVTKMAQHSRHEAFLAGAAVTPPPPANVKAFAYALFALLGIPLAITYSIPFALASIFSTSSGAGQGLSLGVLNLAIVVPQMLVSVSSGPLDKIFGGGGNLPAFVVGAVAAVLSSVLSFLWLPSPPRNAKITFTGGGGH